MEESRTKKTLRNTLFSLAYKVSDVVLAFVLRTIFIHTLGVSYLGLSGLFTNILTVLSLMELGVGAAIVFSLYRPLAENDYPKVAALMRLYKKTYNTIGVTVCAVGILLTPFLKYIINMPENVDNIYLIYWLSVANTAISYFLAYRRSLLIADQRADIDVKNQILFRYTRFVILAICLVLARSFIVYLVLDVVNTLASNIQITYVIKKKYKYIEEAVPEPLTKGEKKSIIKYMSSGVFSKIGQTVVTSTDSIIISAFIGTVLVGVYSNYSMVIAGFDAMVYLLFSNMTASVGNFAVKKGQIDAEKLFRKISLGNYSLAFVITVCVYCLISPFVTIWVGGKYTLPDTTVAVIVLNFYISINQYCVANFMGASGELYYINRFRSLIEGAVNLVASLVLVRYTSLGITGVFLGTTACFLCGRVWMDAHTIYKHWFKVPFARYVKMYILRFGLCAIMCILCKLLTGSLFGRFGINIVIWVLSAIVCVVFSVSAILLVYGHTAELKYYIGLIKKLYNNFKIKEK